MNHMKKSIILSLTLLISILCYSQSGKIIYAVKVEVNQSLLNEKTRDRINKGIDYANKLTFEMAFSIDISSFKKIDQMNENEVDKLSKIIGEGIVQTENIYCNHKNKLELHVNTDNVLIEDPYAAKDWTITNESKKIDTYLCFKAVYKYDFINRKGEKKTSEVTAWFAPSLPYAYGPKNFYGLPGLILELTENKTTYLATKIELSDKILEIKFPKGKAISREDYNKKLKAQMGM
jgi:GLPGLI family protein